MLTVGSDCAIGKMTVSLELDAEARRRGIRSEFVPTGQTGIAIAGWGISVDAVVADFLAGASEQLVLEGIERGGELLWVEGQGSLLHPAYSGVTLGLLHGSAPHALVLCHQAGQRYVDGDERFPIPPLSELVELHERASLVARPARVVAIALNTRDLDDEAARAAVAAAERRDGPSRLRPCTLRASRLTDAVLQGIGLFPRTMPDMRHISRGARSRRPALLPASASANLIVGINDDVKYEAAQPTFFMPTMAADGLKMNALTIRWDETQPTSIDPDLQDSLTPGDRRRRRPPVSRSSSTSTRSTRRRSRAAKRCRPRPTRPPAATRPGSSSSPPGSRWSRRPSRPCTSSSS